MRWTIGRKLFAGFFGIILLMAVGALITYLFIRSMNDRSVKVVDDAFPTAQACDEMTIGINRSLAELRGYTMLGGEEFKESRQKALERVDAALAKLYEHQSYLEEAESMNGQNAAPLTVLAEIKQLVAELKDKQDEVEQIARTDQNIPAYHMMLVEAVPRSEQMLEAITELIDEESKLEAIPERKELLYAFADSRGSLATAVGEMRAYLMSGEEAFKSNFYEQWAKNEDGFARADAVVDLLTETQRVQWDRYTKIRAEFEPLPATLFELRDGDDWNRANYIVKQEAAPRAAAIQNKLEELKNSVDGQLANDHASLHSASNWVTSVLFAVTLLSVIIGFFVAIGLSRDVKSSVRALAERAAAIADGDLSGEALDVSAGDELGQLARAFNVMTVKLREMISKMTTQEEMLAAEARTNAIINATADGIITINEQGVIQSFNSAAEKLFGYSREETIGRNVSMLAPSPHREQHDGYLTRYLTTGEARIIGIERELEGVRRDGSTFPLALRVRELKRDDERIFIGTVQDISERKRTQDAIRDAVTRLASATHEILATTTQQANGAQQQAAVVSQTVATVDEVAQTSEQSAQRANQVAESARRTDEIGTAGRQSIEESIAAMVEVKQQVESIAEHILSLAERAQTIGEITDTVNDIAEQTNVLALNAAVEASRAGEHGKGFAVVASEVKSLADQSKKATAQVRQLLGEIQHATNNAVLSTERGTKAVTTASDVVAKAGDTINTLIDTITESARAATQISASASQQATGVAQLHAGMKNIDKVTKENSLAIQQIEKSAQNLNGLSNELASLVSA